MDDIKNHLQNEMLFAKKLVADCKRESIFKVVKGYMDEKQIPLSNILSCATDGAAAMVGRYKGFIGFLKAAVPDVHTIHCMVHRQHLVAKKLVLQKILAGRLHDSLANVYGQSISFP